jgi:hypothetical protein
MTTDFEGKSQINMAKINGKIVEYDAAMSIEWYEKTGKDYDSAIYCYIGTGTRYSIDGIKQHGITATRFYKRIHNWPRKPNADI